MLHGNNKQISIPPEQWLQNTFDSNSWVILSPIEQSIRAKIEKYGTPLKDWDIQINYGIKTGCNEAFIITTAKRDEILANCKTKEEHKRTDEIIRPILRGRDIKRYKYEWKGLWLINIHNGVKGKLPRIDIEDYPAIKHWLDEGGVAYNGKIYHGYMDIEKRADQGDTPYNLRNCAYLEDFKHQKIVYPETTQGAFFALDKEGFLIDKTCFMLVSKNNLYLQKILSSMLYTFAYKRLFSSIELGDNGYQYNKHALIKLPISSDGELIRKVEMAPQREIDSIIEDFYHLNKEEKTYIRIKL